MKLGIRRCRPATLRLACGLLVLLCVVSKAVGQPPPQFAQGPKVSQRDTGRIDELEATVFNLQSELQSLKANAEPVYRLPEIIDEGPVFATPYSTESCVVDGELDGPTHFLKYDDGWVLRPYDVESSPFELKINLHNQFRYTGFDPTEPNFTNSAGVVVPIEDRNDFDINRGRLVFSGYAFDPKLGFYVNIDYNTVSESQIQLLMGWGSYRFSRALTMNAGLGKVPGTWEWLETSRYTLGADRTMATTFFRPSMTAGFWANGELTDGLYYRALVGNGFNTFTLRAGELDTNLAYSGIMWWEPLGDFGVGFSDLEDHQHLVVRMGQAFTYTKNDGGTTGEPGPEQTVVRLSDGTRLVEPGALTPGVTVNEFDISLYAIHFGMKYRGLSFSTEYFLRWLTSLKGTGPLPIDSLFDHGYFAQLGGFVVPERLELYTSGSQVLGEYGNGSAIAGGVNWYVKGQRGARVTLDVTYLDNSPAQQSRTGYVAGASGPLVRAQFWSFF